MSVGLILLIVAGLLVLLGVGQRVLDKLRLTDKQALLFIALIIAGGFLPEIPLGGGYFINVGGALIPLGLCAYLLVRCQSWQERLRALIASLVTAVAVYAIARFSPDEPEAIWIDPNYLYGLAAGVIGYIFGRSRRGAFIAGVLGVILMDVCARHRVAHERHRSSRAPGRRGRGGRGRDLRPARGNAQRADRRNS